MPGCSFSIGIMVSRQRMTAIGVFLDDPHSVWIGAAGIGLAFLHYRTFM